MHILKYICVIVYFITDIVVENFLIIFANFNSRGKALLESFQN